MAVACLLSGVVLIRSDPQLHWIVYFAQGLPDPPDDYTGTWRVWSANGRLLSEAAYSQGKLDGPSILWDFEGRKKFEKSYREGKLHGVRTSFYTNGSILERSDYTNGIHFGRQVKFYENGMTNFEVFHSRPGARDGPEVHWTEVGERRVLRVWRDGQPWDGRFWSVSNGNSILRINDNGRIVGETNFGRLSPSALARRSPASGAK